MLSKNIAGRETKLAGFQVRISSMLTAVWCANLMRRKPPPIQYRQALWLLAQCKNGKVFRHTDSVTHPASNLSLNLELSSDFGTELNIYIFSSSWGVTFWCCHYK